MQKINVFINSGTVRAAGNFPVALRSVRGGALHSGRFLFSGGETAAGDAVSTVFSYNPATNTFAAAGNFTRQRTKHASFESANEMVVFAGGKVDGTDYSAQVDVVEENPNGTLIFSAGSEMITGRNNAAGVQLPSHRGFVGMGLGSGASPLASTELFSFKTKTFSAALDSPHSKYLGDASVSSPGDAIFNGGLAIGDEFLTGNHILQYSPVQNAFISRGLTARARAMHAQITTSGGDIVSLGGVTDLGGTFAVGSEVFNPKAGFSRSTMEYSLPGVADAQGVSGHGRHLVVGGINASGVTANTFIFQEKLFASYLPESLLIGGLGASSQLQSTAWKFNSHLDTFSASGNTIAARSHAGGSAFDGPDGIGAIIQGGEATGVTDSSEIYDAAVEGFKAGPATGALAHWDGGGFRTINSTGAEDYAWIMAGRDAGNSPMWDSFRYSPYSDSLTTNPSNTEMPVKVASFGAASAEKTDGLYGVVAGGVDDIGGIQDSIWVLNPNTLTWSAPATLALPAEHVTAAQVSPSQVAIMGGRITGPANTQTHIDIFNVESGSISNTGTLVTARRKASALSLGDGSILICGGELEGLGNPSNNCERVFPDGTVKQAGNIPVGVIRAACTGPMYSASGIANIINSPYFAGLINNEEFESGSYSLTLKPGIMQKFDMNVTAGTSVNVSVAIKKNDVYTDSGVSPTAARIELTGCGIAKYLDCTSITDSGWVTFNLSDTPIRDGLVTFNVINNSADPTAELYIDNVTAI